MKAPATAYVIKGNVFLKVLVKGSGHTYRTLAAKYLTTYSSSAAQMKDRVKALFHLDDICDVIEKQPDGTMKVIGFIGMVREGGANARYHNMSKRKAGTKADKSGVPHVLLNDAGLNTLGSGTLSEVAFAFGNYWHLEVTASSTLYEGAEAVTKLMSSLAGQIHASVAKTLEKNSSAVLKLTNRGGMTFFEQASYASVVTEVTNDEGTYTTTAAVRVLAPLNWGPFAPASGTGDVPDRYGEDNITLLIDKVFEDGIYDAVKGLQAPSPLMAPAQGDGDRHVLKLADGESSGTIGDEDSPTWQMLRDYYAYRTKGTGSGFNAPPDGMYIHLEGRTISTQQVYYGIQTAGGVVTGIFRASGPVMPGWRIELSCSAPQVYNGDAGWNNSGWIYRMTINARWVGTGGVTTPPAVTVTFSNVIAGTASSLNGPSMVSLSWKGANGLSSQSPPPVSFTLPSGSTQASSEYIYANPGIAVPAYMTIATYSHSPQRYAVSTLYTASRLDSGGGGDEGPGEIVP